MRNKKIIAVLTAAAILFSGCLLLTACGNKREKTTPAGENTGNPDVPAVTETLPTQEAEQPAADQTAAVPAGTDPLTGLPGYDSDRYGNAKPVAIVVENHPGARPQWGMSTPDVLFEYEVEGGISRMLWLYSNLDEVPAKVGPVRSLRHDVYELALGYDALLVHCGNSNIAGDMMPTYDGSYTRIDANKTSAFTYRDTTRDVAYEHTLVLLGDQLRSYVSSNGLNTVIKETGKHPFSFAAADAQFILTGGNCNSLHFEYSGSYTYTVNYDASAGKYSMNINGNPRRDADGVQCAFKNVVILYVDMVDLHDYSKHQDLVLENGGSGVYASNGTYTNVTWKKDGVTGMLKIYGPDGNELVLNAGNSYIGLVRSTQKGNTSIG